MAGIRAAAVVAVVHDAPITRAALLELVEREGFVGLGSESLAGVVDRRFDELVVLMVAAPFLVVPPRAVLAQLRAPRAALVVVEGAHDPAAAQRCLAEGARGFLSRTANPADVGLAVRAAADARYYLQHELREAVFGRMIDGAPSSAALLTPREMEVAVLLAAGKTTVAIAHALLVSPATAKTHLDRIYSKVGAHNRTAAVAELSRLGVFDRG